MYKVRGSSVWIVKLNVIDSEKNAGQKRKLTSETLVFKTWGQN